jgi:ferredoxin
MLELFFVKQKRTIKAKSGETIREAAIRNKLSIYPHLFKILNCRGRGLCHTCAVEIISGNTEPKNETENQQLAKRLKKNPELRLACQVKVSDNMTIETHV